LLSAHGLHLIHDLKHLSLNLNYPGARLAQLLIAPDPLLGLDQKSPWDRSQFCLTLFTGTDHHAGVKLTLGTLTARLAAFSFEFIDGAFNDGAIGKEGLDKPLHLVYELKKGLAQPTEVFFGAFSLYAHSYNHIQYTHPKCKKKMNL